MSLGSFLELRTAVSSILWHMQLCAHTFHYPSLTSSTLHFHVFWDAVDKDISFPAEALLTGQNHQLACGQNPRARNLSVEGSRRPIAQFFTLERGIQREYDSHKLLSSSGQESGGPVWVPHWIPFPPQLSLPAKSGLFGRGWGPRTPFPWGRETVATFI